MNKKLQWLLIHRKWWLSVVASLLVFWGVLWAFVPGWVKQELENQASQTLGRKVTVAGVKFYPWSMKMEVSGLQIADREGKDWQFKVEHVHANLELSSIRYQAPVVDELRITKPEVRLQHMGKGIYDIDDLLQRFASDPKAPPTETPRFSVYNVSITGGAIDFVDTPAGKTHEVRELEFGLPFISSLPSKRDIHVAPHLALKVNGHPVDLQVKATPFSSSRQGEFHLVSPGVNIQHWLAYWPSQLAFKPTQGMLQADLKLKFLQGSKDKSDQIQLEGKLAMKNAQWAATQGALKGTAIAYDSLELVSQHLGWPLLAASGNDKPSIHLKTDWPRLVQATDKSSAQSAGSLTATVHPLPTGGSVEVKIQDARLESLRPWVAQYLEPKLSGSLTANLQGAWQWPNGKDIQLSLKASEVVVNDMLLDTRQTRPLASGAKPQSGNVVSSSLPLGWKRLGLNGVELAWPLKAIQIDQIELSEPQMEFSRDALGVGNWERWIKASSSSSTSSKTSATPNVKLGKLNIKGGHFVWWDAAAAGPLVAGHEADRSTARIEMAGINLQLQSLEVGAGGLTSKQTPFDLQASVSQISRQQKSTPGVLRVKGDLSGQRQGANKPVLLQVKAAVDIQRLPLHAIEPYLRSRVHMALLQADASVKGQVLFRQPQDGGEPQEIWLKADASLDNVRANSLEPREELLTWKTLQWKGLEYHDTVDKPTVVRVGQSTLSDFYARLIVTEEGRFNLQDVFGKKPVKASASDSTSASAAQGANQVATPVASGNSAAALPAAAEKPTPKGSAEPPADIYIGPSKLINGRINFSDRFIRPNYSAALSELTGELGGFSSRPKDGQIQMADIDLQGKAQGSALLTIKGKLNPLAKPLALDIKANVRDLELPPLSPYAAKYLGYAIDRGKLDVDVSYQVQPDGRLVANNNFILNQLTLGEKIEGQGSSLPLKLAISLLKDRNGMIDVNLPISGSLDDPDFKVAPIVWKLVLNLIGRALTSPFSLIAGAFGGSADQAGQVGFEAGADRLSAANMKQLDQIAKAMQDRPALKANLAGQSSTAAEKAAYQRYQVQRLVLAEHARRNPGSKAVSAAELSGSEYETALKAVYSASSVKKPRNLIGMAKDIAAADMEALLMEAVPLNEDTWRQLALTRAQQVKDYLVKAGLGLERLFIVPPQFQGQTGVALTLTTD